MRLIDVHATVMALCLTVALYCIVSTGILPHVCWLACAVPWFYRSQMLRQKHVSQHVGNVVACACLLWCIYILSVDGQAAATQAGCYGLVGMLTARLATRRTPAHDWHALVLSMLAMFAAAILRLTPMYGVALVVYCVLLTLASITRQFMHAMALQAYRTDDWQSFEHALQRRDVVSWRFIGGTHLVSLALFAMTGVFFMLFPRNVPLAPLDWGMQRKTHFPPNISLFSPPRAANDDHDVIARIYGLNYTNYLQGLYVRGHVYATATRVGFVASAPMRALAPMWDHLAHPKQQPMLAYEIDMLPLDEQHLLTLGYVQYAEAIVGNAQSEDNGITRVGSDELVRVSPFNGWFRYRIVGQQMGLTQANTGSAAQVAPPDYPPAFVQQYLSVPADLDARIGTLSRSLVQAQDPILRQVQKIKQHLLKHYRYTLRPIDVTHRDPLAHFLFEDKQGHCEYFATAFAIMLRSLGIPSRVVGGLQGGIWNDVDASVAFTASQAHAWIEWFDPAQAAWVTDDATPPTPTETLTGLSAWFKYGQAIWDEQILNFDLHAQWQMLQRILAPLRHVASRASLLPYAQISERVLGAACVLLCAVGVMFRLRSRQKAMSLAPEILRLGRLLEKVLVRVRKVPLSHATTFDEAFQQIEAELTPEKRAMLAENIAFYDALRFGRRQATPQQMRQACLQLQWLLRQRYPAEL